MGKGVWLCLVAVLFTTATASARWFGTEFSAVAVQRGPQQPLMTGKMYVGEERVRTEFQQNGHTIVQILSPQQQLAWVLMPERKSYMQQPLPPMAIGPMTQREESDPCAGHPSAQCRRLGTETLGGREAVKWSFEDPEVPQPVNGAIWVDAEHGFSVRHDMGGRTVFQLHYLQDETIAGRQTEKWRMELTGPNGAKMQSTQWYDPELNLAIRQAMPGGYVRELKDIEIAEQPEALFQIPENYQRVQAPAPGTGQR